MENKDKKDNIAACILEKIKAEKIAPIPKRNFLARQTLIWISGLLSVAIGATAISAILFNINSTDWAVEKIFADSQTELFFSILPYTWIIIVVMFILIADRQIRHTKNGYRYTLAQLLTGSILTSVVLGFGMYQIGIGGQVEAQIGEKMPTHRTAQARQAEMWSQPEKGFISGEITSRDQGEITMTDFSQQQWIIITSQVSQQSGNVVKQVNKIKIIGVKEDDNKFTACAIMPYHITRGPLGKLPFATPAGVDKDSLQLINSMRERIVLELRNNGCEGIEKLHRNLEQKNALLKATNQTDQVRRTHPPLPASVILYEI